MDLKEQARIEHNTFGISASMADVSLESIEVDWEKLSMRLKKKEQRKNNICKVSSAAVGKYTADGLDGSDDELLELGSFERAPALVLNSRVFLKGTR